jgi:hypothetical protein
MPTNFSLLLGSWAVYLPNTCEYHSTNIGIGNILPHLEYVVFGICLNLIILGGLPSSLQSRLAVALRSIERCEHTTKDDSTPNDKTRVETNNTTTSETFHAINIPPINQISAQLQTELEKGSSRIALQHSQKEVLHLSAEYSKLFAKVHHLNIFDL